MAINDDEEKDVEEEGGVDSTMELERPGEEKKKRLEAKAVAKSAGLGSGSSSVVWWW